MTKSYWGLGYDQTVYPDIEFKNTLTVTRWEVGGDNGGQGEGFSGTSIKDTWTKPKGDRIKGGKWGQVGCGGLGGK